MVLLRTTMINMYRRIGAPWNKEILELRNCESFLCMLAIYIRELGSWPLPLFFLNYAVLATQQLVYKRLKSPRLFLR